MEKKDRDRVRAMQILKRVTSRVASDPSTPIRASSPEFAEIPRLLTATGWEWMFFEDIDRWPAQRRDAIHARLNRSRGRFRARLLGDVLLQQCFKVNLFMYLHELLLRKVGGENVVKNG